MAKKSEKQKLIQDTVKDKIIDREVAKKIVDQRLATKGNGKYVTEGMIARLFNYYLINPETITDVPSRVSFEKEGYINGANRLLITIILSGQIPSKIYDLTKKIPEDLENISVEQILYNVGMKDAEAGYVVENEIIKNNIYYQKGYNEIFENQKSKGRK